MVTPLLSIIVAMTDQRVIGKDGKLPWNKLDGDLPLFKENTNGGVLIMGRKTFDSIGKPLPGRENLVISSKPNSYFPEGIMIYQSFNEGLDYASSTNKNVHFIGGVSIYKSALPIANKLQISHVKEDYKGDTYFPEFNLNHWEQLETIGFNDFTFKSYSRKTN